ncbi:transcription factor A, mitochondrial isoform X1 [Hylaeus anthracinus]|uniref:transcription factor A, mitochondrial isoform X1 n=2 Tax=Hylaeus anthracinus TaxID=313031 RepID=UPI0023B95B43|nr:transcription factor A, mitochondrial isoform X1 [Hylaeus anthracinus]
MAGFGRLIASIGSRNLMCPRSYLPSSCQSVARSTAACLKENLPMKPKRPQPAFFLYIQSVRQKILNENPSLKSSEVVQMASKEWANMDSTLKENYRIQYKRNYEVYQEELQKFKSSLTKEQLELMNDMKIKEQQMNLKKENKLKQTIFKKPKRPQNAFLLFLKSQRDNKSPDMSSLEWLKSMKEKWNDLPNEEKQQLSTEAAQLMIQYEKDLANWEREMITLGHSEIVRSKTLRSIKEKE